MHLMIPFAAPLSEAGRAAATSLALPHLRALLATLTPAGRDEGEEWSLSTPHERALALAWAWTGADGRWPWAARLAAADGLDIGSSAWGLLTPAHWHLGTEQVSLIDPAGLMLNEAGSRVFFDAIRDLFESEGYRLTYGNASRWYLSHDSLADLPCASLDRVIGRNVDRWLGNDPAVRRVRRLQSEVQMQLYTHPLNDERQAQGLLPVNSFWLSGCGRPQAPSGATVNVDERLRHSALNDDWAAWCKAWDSLDAGPVADALERARAGQPVRLTLCGERSSQSWVWQAQGFFQRWRARWSGPDWRPILESL